MLMVTGKLAGHDEENCALVNVGAAMTAAVSATTILLAYIRSRLYQCGRPKGTIGAAAEFSCAVLEFLECRQQCDGDLLGELTADARDTQKCVSGPLRYRLALLRTRKRGRCHRALHGHLYLITLGIRLRLVDDLCRGLRPAVAIGAGDGA